MLLAISPDTKRSKLYSVLNECLLMLFSAKLDGKAFDSLIFPSLIRDAIWGNAPTQQAFYKLWKACCTIDKMQLDEFYRNLTSSQEIGILSVDKNASMPLIPDEIQPALSFLGSHLYEHTSKLKKITDAVGETVQSYYIGFRSANGQICPACGMRKLTEWLSDTLDDDQYRPPNDHYLSREYFPYFAVHPENLIPICSFCNEKAKGRKNVACKADGSRRLFPNPWNDCFSTYIAAKITHSEFRIELSFEFLPSLTGDLLEKASVWEDVFLPFSRVSGHIDDLSYRVDCLISPTSFDELKAKISSRSLFYKQNQNKEEYGYWYSILLNSIEEDSKLLIEIWNAIEAQRSDKDCKDVFCI